MTDITNDRHLGLIKWLVENKMDQYIDVCIEKAMEKEYFEILEWVSLNGYLSLVKEKLCWPYPLMDSFVLIRWAFEKGYIDKERAARLACCCVSDGNINAFAWALEKDMLSRYDIIRLLASDDNRLLNTPVGQLLIDTGVVTLQEIKEYHYKETISYHIHDYYFPMIHIQLYYRHTNYAIHNFLCQFEQEDQKIVNAKKMESLVDTLHKISRIKPRQKQDWRNLKLKKATHFPKSPHSRNKPLSKQSNKRPVTPRYHRN